MKSWVFLITLLILSTSTQAEMHTSKDWSWNISGNDYVYAATINKEGRVLGQYCYYKDSSCYYLVGLGITVL